MDDNRIIELYFARDERAIEETKLKYSRLLLSIAGGILGDLTAAEECENDTYLRTWDSIPPVRPTYFAAYIGRITRNLALNRIRYMKRHNPPEMILIMDELSEIVGEGEDLDERIDLGDALSGFLADLEPTRRRIFIQRYFYMMSAREIAVEQGLRTGTVRSVLSRTRNLLREYLCERGIVI